MKEEIRNILMDIYQIDSDLKNNEEDLVKIIGKLLQSKPDTKFDQEFYLRLKQELASKTAEEKKVEKENFWKIFFVSKFSYSLAGALAVLIIVMPIIFREDLARLGSGLGGTTEEKSAGQRLTKLEGKAFGSLLSHGIREAGGGNAFVDGLGGGGAPAVTSLSTEETIKDNSAYAGDASAKMIADGGFIPEYTEFKYVYAGEDFELEEAQIEVFRRAKGKTLFRDPGDVLDRDDIGLMDAEKFKNTGFNTLNLVEDREFGYEINYNFDENSMSLYANWDRWPHPEDECDGDEECYARYRMKKADVPDDSELIAIADEFISDYGIDRSNYGTPQVSRYWEEYAEIAGESQYIPDAVSVLYPLLINAKEAYDSAGNKNGLSIDVNMRYKKVSGVISLQANNYQVSEYEAVTDAGAIIDLAEKGGNRFSYDFGKPIKTITVELGTPYQAMMQYYSYSEKTNKTEELYVPALIFPITNVSDKDEYYGQDFIVVPLVKEVFDEYNKEPDNTPMPFLRGEEPMIKSLDVSTGSAVEGGIGE